MMQPYWLLYPLIAMTGIIFFTGFKLLSCRYQAVREGLSPNYFLLNRGGKAPAYLLKTTQHYDNLFELPILFYLVVILLFLLQQANYLDLILCWLFIFGRIGHAIIHLGRNRLSHRKMIFLISSLVLLALWLKLFYLLLYEDLTFYGGLPIPR